MNDHTSDNNSSKSYNPLVDEKKILHFWTKKHTFEKIQENLKKENNGTVSFHCGPPFLTGSPHCGHILNAVMKDIFTRYCYQKKLQVISQFGWDCHGLAIEHEVDKKLEIETLEDIEKLGITTYNDECRKCVERHEAEWTNIFEGIGNWVDFTNSYSTMSVEYMESVWGVFKQLYDIGLVYRDTKILPYSIGCFTHLSYFEAEQNCKETAEVSLTISINIVDSNMMLLIWTTASWTLVDNLAVCVNPNSTYVKVQMTRSDNVYILSQNRLPFVFTSSDDYFVLEEMPGKQLQGLRYKPLFDYLSESANAFQVLADEYVRDDLGTGIEALSPHFSEDAYRVCKGNGIECDEVLCPIDNSGRFKQHVSEMAGISISEAKDGIVETLQRRGHLVDIQNIKQRTQHCWRSDVPLIRKLASTWFIKLEGLTTKLMENNSQVNWFHCKRSNEFAFSGDWAVGRNKFWGTPVPIWSSSSGDEIRCIGSVEELLQLTGRTSVSDLHRESVDEIRIPSSIPGNPPLRRVPDVFDCWFESGVMPFIQQRTQADFVVEGIDQASGWFHATSVLASALCLPPASRNIVAHGLVESSDGTKVSKRKHNHSDPIHIAQKYGADALRLYLVTTPLVNGDNFIIQEDEVRKMVDNIIHPLSEMVYSLVPKFGRKGSVFLGIINGENSYSTLHQWILSCTESLIQFHDTELTAYRLHSIIPRVIKLIEQIRDWYIPLVCAEKKLNDKNKHYHENTFVLYNVVYKTCLVLAPFAPFLTEHIYQMLEPFVLGCFRTDFVHDSLLPRRSDSLIKSNVELQVGRWQMIVELIRQLRINHVIPIQYRINELIVVHPVDKYLEDDEPLKEIMMKLTNVHQITMSTDRSEFGATLTADIKANSALHQSMSQTQFEEITKMIKNLNDGHVEDIVRQESLPTNSYNIPLEDIQINYKFEKESEKNIAIASKDDLLIVIRMNKDLEYYAEGTRLELVNCVKKLKNKAKIFRSQLVTVCYSTEDKCLLNAFQKYANEVKKSTNAVLKWIDNACTIDPGVAGETVDIKGVPVTMYLLKSD